MSSKYNETNIKIVCIGDGAVGKTSMLLAYTANEFTEDYEPTIFENYSTNVVYKDRLLQLNLWDTSGQEDYDKLRPLSYPDTDVFMICYSTVCHESLINVKNKWIPELKNTCMLK
jgi:small GTP-binding protein